jgi:hypothetical protein
MSKIFPCKEITKCGCIKPHIGGNKARHEGKMRFARECCNCTDATPKTQYRLLYTASKMPYMDPEPGVWFSRPEVVQHYLYGN